jgi:hypothetical protein
MHDEDEAKVTLADEIIRECACVSLQRFIRDNFGLYRPPGDYAALRRENLRRSLDPKRISQGPGTGL